MIRAENVMYNRGYKRDTKGSGKPKKKPDINECAEKKLARKEMSAKELSDYLTKKEYDSQEIDTVISTLLEFGYLNDARFATEYLIYDLGRGRSLFQCGAFGLEDDALCHADRGGQHAHY